MVLDKKNPMKTIVLISCVKTKLSQPAMAKDLYTSDLFQKSYRYAQLLNPDRIFILSAKYGLLLPEIVIEPYEMTLKSTGVAERKKWSNEVLEALKQHTDLKRDKYIILCGAKYRQYLLPGICNYEIPMNGLRNGQQKHWLKEKLEHGHV